MVKKVNKTKYILIVVTTILLMLAIVFFVGRSFGFFQYVKEGEVANIITINGIEVNIESTSANSLDLGNAEPMYDSLGLQREPFIFTLSNTASKAIDFSLIMVNDEERQSACVLDDGLDTPCPELSTDYIKYAYKFNNGSYSTPQVVGDNNDILFITTLQGNETRTVSVILWIDSNAGNEIQGSYFYGKLILQGTQTQAVNFKQTILNNNKLVTTAPDLTTTSQAANEKGLYVSYETNTGDPTYYFRGAVENNYVDFAGFTWRIVRVNEDGTVRLIMQDGINDNANYQFNSARDSEDYMYYSNSDTAKPTLELWYETNIVNKNYDSYVAKGSYYCEQAKVAYKDFWATNSSSNMITYDNYIANFNCENDNYGYGIVNSNIGLISYDELVYAGGYVNVTNNSFYLNNENYFWTISPAGRYTTSMSNIWRFIPLNNNNRKPYSITDLNTAVDRTYTLRPVINLRSDVKVTGDGTSGNPYKVVTEEKLVDAIFKDNELQQVELTDAELSTVETNDNTGKIFKSTKTNDGTPTYFFRGAVNNNYVEFAGFTWRIVRINEDGTVRLIMEDGINNNATYSYSSQNRGEENYYYSNDSIAKTTLEDWYQTNIANTNNNSRVVEGNYFCEQKKVTYNSSYLNYSPDYICSIDNNDHGLVYSKIGLINYDEAVFAGGYFNDNDNNYYLRNIAGDYWTMSPAGVSGGYIKVWRIKANGAIYADGNTTTSQQMLRPVINLKSDTIITKDSNGHYVVQ